MEYELYLNKVVKYIYREITIPESSWMSIDTYFYSPPEAIRIFSVFFFFHNRFVLPFF